MEITQEILREKINNGEKLLVDFWAPWCRPCGIMKPVFENLAKEYRNENSEVQLYTLDVEKNRELASELGIRAIPTIKSFNAGKVYEDKVGVLSEIQLKDLVKNLING